MARILLIGAGGQLGTDLGTVLAPDSFVPLTRRDLDVTDREAIERVLAQHRPAWVINTAAFHRVDDIEMDEHGEAQLAFAVNAVAARRLAVACEQREARLLHLSTDYVFGGGPPGPYAEDASPAPLSVYGASKLAGELLVRQVGARHVIVRSSGLYGVAGSAGKGGNFVETMLKLADTGKPIRVVDDQVLTPTFTRHLATAIASLIAADPPGGIYHLTSSGQCSWYEFARAIFELGRRAPRLEPTTSAEFSAPARRPLHSVLRNTRAAALGVPLLPPWRRALEAYLRAKRHLVD